MIPASAEELHRLSQMLPDKTNGTGGSNVKSLATVTAADFAGNPPPERKSIVTDLIPDRNVTDLAGDGGIGKSLIALQLAVAMDTGTDWLGHMPEPGRVLYVSCEDELDEIHRRLDTIARSKRIPLAELGGVHIADLTTAPGTELAAMEKGRLSLTPLFHGLAQTVALMRPKLAIVDTRADVFGGNEIDRGQVRFFVRALRRLCLEYDMAVLLLSHPSVAGMNTGTGQSGSTAWGNSVRSRLYLEKPKADDGTEPDPDLRVLRSLKANYGPADTTITLRWKAGVFAPDGTGPGMLDRIARDNAVEARFLEILRDFDRQGRHANNAGGPNYAPKAFSAADNGTIGHRQFRAAMDRLFAAGRLRIEPFGPPSRGTKRIVEVTP